MKVGCVTTVRAIAVDAVKLPEVPVTRMLNDPAIAVELALRVSTLVAEVLVGLKDAVTPNGNADADMVTVPLNPLSGLMVMVLLPLVP